MDDKAQHFSSQVIRILNERVGEYVLFYYGYHGAPVFSGGETPTILLPKARLDSFLVGMRTAYPGATFNAFGPGNGVDIQLQEGDQQLSVHCVHRLLYKSLCLMDELEISQKRTRHRSGFYMPAIEHLFEHAVLQCWMEYRGLADRFVRFFEDLHVFVQEDVLEYFNQKYATSFGSLHEFSEFQPSQRDLMLRVLKSSPANGFMQHVRQRLFGVRARV